MIEAPLECRDVAWLLSDVACWSGNDMVSFFMIKSMLCCVIAHACTKYEMETTLGFCAIKLVISWCLWNQVTRSNFLHFCYPTPTIFKATANRYMFIFENMQTSKQRFQGNHSFTSIAGIIKIKSRKRRRNGKSWSNLAFDQLVVWCKKPAKKYPLLRYVEVVGTLVGGSMIQHSEKALLRLVGVWKKQGSWTMLNVH